MSRTPKAKSGAGYSEWPGFLQWLLSDLFKPIQTTLEGIMSDLQNVKATLEANTAKIEEISGDIDELQTTNTELVMKVDELKAQLPDNQLVADIVGLVNQQSETLSTVAAKVPEPEPAPEPTEEV